MTGSDQRAENDIREKIGMIGSFPPPRRSNTKIDVMYNMMDVLSEKMEVLSKEKVIQAQKRMVLDEKMKTLSKEDTIQAEKRVVLNEKMEIMLKILDVVS
ncbi:hypothetical protein FJTKL_01277 [Diaporthe vaccinii]|uniref:Uncharacterized protein n=1 Tax=Diaporthe vaccinii TaxID=105482 RepID=A0ABR4E1C9_9PEZI